VAYLCSCCGVSCTSAPSRRPLPATPGCHYDTWQRRRRAWTAWRPHASTTSRVNLLALQPEAPRHQSLATCWTSCGTSPRRPAQTTHVNEYSTTMD
jgi:hypothetical protein